MARNMILEKSGFDYTARLIRRTYRGEEQYKLIVWKNGSLYPKSYIIFRSNDSSVIMEVNIELFLDRLRVDYTIGKGMHEIYANTTRHEDWIRV